MYMASHDNSGRCIGSMRADAPPVSMKRKREERGTKREEKEKTIDGVVVDWRIPMNAHEPARTRTYDLHIFCDFDGTIATVDVGADLFRRFGRVEPWLTEADAGRLPIADFWRAVARELHTPPAGAALDEYLLSIPIDPGFAGLLELARAEGIPFMVVSDGLDLYVQRYLELNGAGDVAWRCNHAHVLPDGTLAVSFPDEAEGCCRRYTVSCKRNVLLQAAHPDARIVYIGDGLSDHCAAEHADIIFAKRDLAAHCNARRLPHYPFKTLADVERQLRLLLARRRIRPRHQAALLRKSAWEEE